MSTHDPDAKRQFPKKTSYNFDEILAFANREFGNDLPPLPLPPMLMLHRVIDVSSVGGEKGIGCAIAEYDVKPEDWYFSCHFKENPVMPGCLGIDAVQQLAGFMLAWSGARGNGMAMSLGLTKYRGMVTPDTGTIRIGVDVEQLKLNSRLQTIRANGCIWIADKLIYEMSDICIGVVRQSG